MGETLRAFIALDLPEEAKATVSHFVAKHKGMYPDGKWVSKDHLHVTLAFFPALPAFRVQDIERILESLKTQFPPYEAFLNALGAFPSWQRTRVLWAGFDEEGGKRTKAIAEVVFAKLQDVGIPYEEERTFIPHVTLARFRNPKKLDHAAFPGWSPVPVTIREVALFESILKPSGPVYRKLVYVWLEGVRV